MKIMYRLILAIAFVLGFQKAEAQCFVTTPWSEDFSGNSWTTPFGITNSGSIPSCWSRVLTTGNYLWMAGPPAFVNANTGPDGDHTTGSGQYAYAESWFPLPTGGSNRDVTHLVTPKIDLSSDTIPRVEFYYHLFGSQISFLELRARKWGTTGWDLLQTFNPSSTTFSANSSPWLKASVSLQSYAGDTIQLRFTAKRTTTTGFNTASRVAIDDITVEETPSCDDPFNLVASNPTVSSASLSWSTVNSGQLAYQVQYASQGTTIGNGPKTIINSNPGTLNGLNANTLYRVRVREICSAGDTSAWSNVTSFKTACSYFTAPFFEDFDGSTWAPPTNFNSQGTIDDCWSEISSGNRFWNVGPLSFMWTQTGPTSDHTSGTGQFLFHQVASSVGATQDPKIITPWIDLDTLTNPEVSFWYHGHGQNMGDLDLYVQKQGGTWTALWDTSGTTHNSNTAAWKEKIINLGSTYEGDTVRFKFEYTLSTVNFFTRFAIDDFRVDRQPACPKGKNAVLSAVGINVAQLDWDGGGASNFQIRYKEVGTSTWTWTTANTSAKGIPGLDPQTTYEWEVRDSCASGSTSTWVKGERFTTLCTIFTAPFQEDFSSTTNWVIPDFTDQNGEIDWCWSRGDTTDYFWTSGNSGFNHFFGTGPDGDHTTGSGGYAFARSGSPWTSPTFTDLRTPQIDLDTLQSPELTFWYHMFGSDIDKLEVYVKPIGQNAVKVATINGQQQTSSTANWKRRKVSLLNYEGDTIRVIFRAKKAAGSFTAFRADMAIDDINIDETTTCNAPTVLSSNITYNSATINWNTRASTSGFEYGPQPITQGSGTVLSVSGGTYDLTNLLPNTTYSVWVNDSCTSNLASPWTLHTFTTLPCPSITAQGSVTVSGTSVSAQTTTTPVDSVIWNWGDGNSTNGATANHTYTSFGTFSVQQVVFNDCGNTDTLLHTVDVCGPVTLNPTSTATGLMVDFDASTSVGTGLTYTWDFGQGSTSNDTTTSFTYGSAGTYTVTLTAVDACGNSSSTSFDITICNPVNLTFSSVPNGSTFNFTATPLSLMSYSWDFGDGNSATGPSVTHTYGANGSYTVTLTAEDSCGNTYTYSDVAATCDEPAGDFTFNIVTTSSNGMVVDFQATATGATKFHWFWGDGTNDKGNTPNAQHTYGVVTLNYTVRLLLINDCGDTTEVQHKLNEVGIAEDGISAEVYPVPFIDKLTVDFQNSTSGEVMLYSTLGKKILAVSFENEAKLVLDVANLPSGNYFVAIRSEENYSYYPIVKI